MAIATASPFEWIEETDTSTSSSPFEWVNQTVAAAGASVFIPIIGHGPGMSLAHVGGGLAGRANA